MKIHKYLCTLLMTLIGFHQFNFAQSIRDLKKRSTDAARTESPSRSNTTNYSGSGAGTSDNCGEGLIGCFYSCMFLGDILVKLGDEEGRLLKRNVEESRLFAVEGDLNGAYGFRDFAKLQGQIRLHLGLVSMGFRYHRLFDKTGTFNTGEFALYLNLVNTRKFKLRGMVGLLFFNHTYSQYLSYGGAIEFFPTWNTRVELFSNLTPLQGNGFGRPRQEAGVRFHFDVKRKGFLNSSVFAGISNQLYFNEMNFPGLEIGLNCFLAFHRFQPKTNQTPAEIAPAQQGF